MPKKISAVLIVRDEQRFLRRCLEAARAAVDEIVVVDTGSTDDTVAIAQELADVVGHFTWCDDFSAARNHALSLASGTHVLSLDADEEVQDPERAREKLRAFAEAADPLTLGTVLMVQPVRHGDHAEQIVKQPLTRFFSREHFHYTGTIHEQLTPNAGEMTVAPTGVVARHAGYQLSPDTADAKSLRNLKLLRAALNADPHDSYLRYQMGKSFFALGRYGMAAIHLCQAHAEFLKNGMRTVPQSVLTDLATLPAYALINDGKLEEAEDFLAEQAVEAHAGTRGADFPQAQGYLALINGEYARAERHFETALSRGADAELVEGTGSHIALYHLGLLHEARNERERALPYYADCLRAAPSFAAAANRVAAFVIEDIPGVDAVFREIEEHAARAAVKAAWTEAGETELARERIFRAWRAAFGERPGLLD